MKDIFLNLLAITILIFIYLVFNDLGNIVISIISIFLVFISFYSLGKVNLKSYNIFTLTYFGGLFTSTFRLSSYQTTTELNDLYFYFFGPIVFILTLYFFERLKPFRESKFKKYIKIEVLYLILLFVYVGIKLYIGKTLGWRIESVLATNNTLLASGNNYTIPGISGLSAIIQWMLLIFAPYVKKRYVFVSMIFIIIFSGILHVKRGDIFRVFVFLLVWYSHNKLKLKSLSSLIGRVSLLTLLLFLVFVKLGNLRQELRGANTEYLRNNIGIEDASVPLIWFYGYVSINYEVLKHYYNSPPTYDPGVIKLLFLSEVNDDLSEGYSINGFNASTFLSGFIKEFGYFYFIEMIVFGIIIGLLIYFIKGYNFQGAYLFLISMFFLSFFGNYLAARSIFFAILISLILFPFLKFRVISCKA